jgi:transcriptional regulator with XRE-family HTH domain
MRGLEVSSHLAEKMKDPYFEEMYQLEEQKLAIVKRIIAYRLKNGLTQRQLAARIGITQQHLSKIEQGDFASVTTLEKVLLAIGYTVKLTIIRLAPQTAERIRKALPASR